MKNRHKRDKNPMIPQNQKSTADVARLANVSKMTVSRVMNGLNWVSEETRKKVLKVANEIGYQPHRVARALKTGRSGMVGFLVNYMNQSLRGEFNGDAFVAFDTTISDSKLSIVLSFILPDQDLTEQVRNLYISNNCEAIVIRLDEYTPKDLDGLASLNIPILLMNFNPVAVKTTVKLPSVGFDNIQGVQQAVHYLASLGHERIAYLGGATGWMDTDQRELGFLKGMKDRGLKIKKEWMRDCSFAYGHVRGVEHMTRILSDSVPLPTAVICASDELAAGAMSAIIHWGKSIPKDISVIGFNNHEWSAYITPSLTTIQHPGWELGEKTGRYLLELLNNPLTPQQNIVLETKLIIRESTGIAPKS